MDEVKVTNRGFEYIEFKDCHRENCLLQQSSMALNDQPGSSAVWLGIRNKEMHLVYDQVKELVNALQNWLDTGSFRDPIKKR